MKNLSLIIFFLQLFLSAQSQVPDFIRETKQIAAWEKKANAWKLSGDTRGIGSDYDLKYHRCEWNIDPNVYYISGNVTSYFTPDSSGFIEIDFDFSTAMSVDSVTYHGAQVPFAQQSGDVLAISLPNVIPQGTLDSVSVFYQGAPVGSGFGSFIQSTHGASYTPVIWTLSEPFGARDWWPCKQTLNDKVDSIDIYVRCPSEYRDGSNGVLISEIQNGSNKTYHWKSHYPIAAYLVAIAVTNYSQYSNYVTLLNGASLQVLNYVYPEDSALAASLTPQIVPVIQLYDSLTIDYPFFKEKYGHCEFGWGGGMEHQTMTYCVIFDTWLIAHECAHQWFGDKVTCGSWQDIWLNEGFATYFEALTEQDLYPWEWENWKTSNRDYIVSAPDGSVLCTDTNDVGRIFDGRLSYSKGAYVLHMLRWQLSDSLFFEGLRQYLLDPNLAYGYAKTPDLQQHLEAVSGQDLTTFFNQWYYNQGYPTYYLSWYPAGNNLNLTISQIQSDPSVSFFEMPVPVEFKNTNHDTTVVLFNSFSGQSFSISLGFIPDQVIFDPELWVLHADDVVTEADEPLQDDEMISVFPNPATDALQIVYHLNSSENILITDASGQVVKTILNNSKQSTVVDLASLSPGVYYVKLMRENIPVVKKFVKL